MKRFRFLTYILSRAVSGVRDARIDSVEISCVRYRTDMRFYIYVLPDQSGYWKRFRERYPDCTRLARERNAKVHNAACPEFCSRDALIDWLSEVLGLTDGERKLLLLDVGL